MDRPPADRTAAYVVAAHPCFEDLRHVAAQLAGLLVLGATGSRDASPHHPLIGSATLVHAQASDGVRQSYALVDETTREHHHALVAASAALTAALAAVDTWPIDLDAVLNPLKVAYGHLQTASNALPGFSMVSFEQACCGRRP